jgi:hypothetical protein
MSAYRQPSRLSILALVLCLIAALWLMQQFLDTL